MDPHQIAPENAVKIADWLKNRGGICIWDSINLSNPGKTWTAPLNGPDGNLAEKPSSFAGRIIRIIHNPSDIVVVEEKEVGRFRVPVRMGSNGLNVKVTDSGSRRIRIEERKAAEKYGDAWYRFDYTQQSAVIYVPGETLPLADWLIKAAIPEPPIKKEGAWCFYTSREDVNTSLRKKFNVTTNGWNIVAIVPRKILLEERAVPTAIYNPPPVVFSFAWQVVRRVWLW
jgi:hypothetical protein